MKETPREWITRNKFDKAIKALLEGHREFQEKQLDMKEENKEPNKCDEGGLYHAWSDGTSMYGFEVFSVQECANCGLKRSKHYESREWWSYSDGRPDEPIFNIRPV